MFISLGSLTTKYARSILLIAATVAGLTVALCQATQFQESKLENVRADLLKRHASGRTVLVKIDEDSLIHIGAWPWPRSVHGALVNKLHAAGASRIIFSVDFTSPSPDPRQDIAFSEALKHSGGSVVLPGDLEPASNASNEMISLRPIPELARYSSLTNLFYPDSHGTIQQGNYYEIEDSHIAPSISYFLSGRKFTSENGYFPIDWSVDPYSFDEISYYDVLKGRFDPAFFRDREVLVGATANSLGDWYPTPTYGALPGVLIHLVAGETLRRGIPYPIGQYPMLGLAVAILAGACFARRTLTSVAIIVAGIILLLAIPLCLRWTTPIVVGSAAALTTMLAAICTQCVLWIVGFFGPWDKEMPSDRTPRAGQQYQNASKRPA